MSAVQAEGVFLVYNRSANTYIIGTAEGREVEARFMITRPVQNRRSAEKLSEIKSTPWSTRERAEVTVRFEPAGEAQAPT